MISAEKARKMTDEKVPQKYFDKSIEIIEGWIVKNAKAGDRCTIIDDFLIPKDVFEEMKADGLSRNQQRDLQEKIRKTLIESGYTVQNVPDSYYVRISF